MFKRLILSLLFCVAATTASQAWTIDSSTDAFTDEQMSRMCAFTSGQDEVCIMFVEQTKGTHLMISIALSDSTTDVFAHQRWPLLRIDRNEAQTPEDVLRIFRELEKNPPFPAKHEHRWVIWGAQFAERPGKWKNTNGILYQLVKGNEMLIRLPLHGSYHRDVSLSLSGFTAALKQIAPPAVMAVF